MASGHCSSISTHVRSVLLFNRTTSAKARDFNWHNVIGVWSAIPLSASRRLEAS
jgi:hypothetical protein